MSTPSQELAAGVAPAPGAPRLPDRLARRALLRRLERLRDGALRIREAGSEHVRGAGPEVVVDVHDSAFWRRVAAGGSLGAARAYVDGAWDCEDLAGLFALLVRNIDLLDAMEGGLATLANAADALRHRWRRNTRAGSRRNIHAHYDLGNPFFERFLDETMTYSSAVFEHEAATLAEAQRAKLDRVCRKLALRPGQRVVEIGAGWGSFAEHAAKHYGAHVTSTTLSAEQHAYAEERIRRAGLGDRVALLRRDYRDLEGEFDALVSIEMIEAVGHAFLPEYFRRCAGLLAPHGAACIQAITMPDRRYAQYLRSNDFIREMVFPGSSVPSLGAMLEAVLRASDLRPVGIEEIGPHYARTLRAWRARFESASQAIRGLGYDERFMRTWRYYLCYCEAGFAERYTGAVQLVLDKPGRREKPVIGRLPRPGDCR